MFEYKIIEEKTNIRNQSRFYIQKKYSFFIWHWWKKIDITFYRFGDVKAYLKKLNLS